MEAKFDQSLHEKLCAYVLGESEGADRAEVERELLRSPEMRAEKERLERTIGAVRGALGPAETLNPAAHAALERAVRPARSARTEQFPWLRLAAGIAAIGLGWWIFQGPVRDKDAFHQQVATLSDSRAHDLERRRGAQAAATRDQDFAKLEQGQTIEPRSAPSGSAAHGAGGSTLTGGTPVQTAAEPPADTRMIGDSQRVRVSHELERTGPQDVAYEEIPLSLGAAGVGTAGRAGPSSPAAARGSAGPATGGASNPSGSSYRKGRAGGPTRPSAATPNAQDNFRGAGDSLPTSASPARPVPKDARPPIARLDGEDNLRALGHSAGDEGDRARRQAKIWHQMTPDEQAHWIEWRCGTIVHECTPRPNERPRDMFFRFWGDNPFEVAALDKLSTFSIDVDTASYALARRYLNEGKVPEKAQVRTEEFVNYFRPDISAPVRSTFAVHTDLTPSRFSADAARQMLRVVVRAKDVDKNERQPLRLTFVVDVSGSMKEQNRLETVKHALRQLVNQLDSRDSIALVKFSTVANLVLPMTAVVDRVAIENAIAPLVPDGSTNSNAGLQLGYAQALAGLEPHAVNRVVFLSDGVANVGETDAEKILAGVQSIREKGIFLNTVGVGMNNHNDVLLEQLANKGDGMCNYVDSPKEIQRALVDRFTGAFQPIARDVKVQVEFDPDQVLRYRLLGYENRAIADADFRNDAVDAGEIGAGHQVTALYEIEPTGRASDKPMATVRLRWKPMLSAGTKPESDSATEAAFDVSAKSYQAYESSPAGHRRALVVAQFAEILRRSAHARGDSLDELIRDADVLRKQIPDDEDFAEFTALLLRSKDLILRTLPDCDDLCRTVDLLRTNRYLDATAHEMGRDARTLEEIERTTRELELRLRDLLRKQADDGELPAMQGLGYTAGRPK